MPNLTPGHLFMLGRSAASNIIYVRPVGSPENTSNIGEKPNINNLVMGVALIVALRGVFCFKGKAARVPE